MASELIFRGGHESHLKSDEYDSPKPLKPWLTVTRPIHYLLREQRLVFLVLGIGIATLIFSLTPSSSSSSPSSKIDINMLHDSIGGESFLTAESTRLIPTHHSRVSDGFRSGKVPLGLKRKGLRIVVTGGAGFVGSHLVDRLIARGDSVIVVDNFFTGRKENVMHHFGNPRFELIRHDVVEPLLLEVDQIYHLACPASPVHYKHNPVKTIKTNVVGTLNMLGLAKRVGARFLLTSTSEVYGDPLEHPQKETYWGNVNPIGVRSCYDEGKRTAETLTMDYHRGAGVEVRIARIFNTYGPRMCIDDGRVVSNFVAQALRKEPMTVYGDGKQTRSFQFVSDLVEGLMRLMEGEHVGPFNLGNPGEFTMLELAKVVQETIDPNAKIEFRPNTEDDPHKRKPDIGKAKELLGWEPKIALRKGLPMMVSVKSIHNSPMEIEPPQSTTSKQPAEHRKEAAAKRGSKKRKFEEAESAVVEEAKWSELGEICTGMELMSRNAILLKSTRFIPGFCVNLEWCNACKYSEILEILEAQKWVKLFGVCYDNILVHGALKEFCDNWSFNKGVASSKVKNIEISFDAEYLSSIFGTPNKGYDYYFTGTQYDGNFEGVSVKDMVKSIGGNPLKCRTNHKTFTPVQKILFVFVWQAIIPCTQHRYLANHRDVVLLYLLENRIPINFPSLMLKHLNHTISQNLKVGYANLLTTLFESFGITFEGYETLKYKPKHYLQPSTLKAMNICIVGGKSRFMTENQKKKVGVDSEMEDSKVEAKSEGEQKSKENEKIAGELKIEEEKHINKRKSVRIAMKSMKKVITSPVFLDLTEEAGTKGEIKENNESVPSSVSPKGFASFSSSCTTNDLKELKEAVKSLSISQLMIMQRLEMVEAQLENLTNFSTNLVSELKKNHLEVTDKQKELMDRLEDLVVEDIPEEDTSKQHLSPSQNA